MINVALKRFPLKNTVFESHISVSGAFFRYRHRAGVKIKVIVAERPPRRNMSVTVKKNVATAERGLLFHVEVVPVCGID